MSIYWKVAILLNFFVYTSKEALSQSTYDSLRNNFLRYYKSDYDSALIIAQRLHEHSRFLDDKILMSKAHNMLGYSYKYLGNFDSAEFYYLKALRNSMNSDTQKMYVYNSLGLLYYEWGKYSSALDHLYKSYDLRLIQGNNEELSIVLLNIGLVYYGVRSFEKALNLFKQSADLTNTSTGKQLALLNMSLCYTGMHHLDSAQSMLTRLRNTCKPDCSSSILSEMYSALANVQEERENPDSAIYYYNMAITSRDKHLDIDMAVDLTSLAELEFQKQNFGLALSFLDSSQFILFNFNNPKWLSINYKLYSKIYSSLGSFEASLRSFNKYDSLREIFYGYEKLNELTSLQLQQIEKSRTEELGRQEDEIRSKNLLLGLISLFFLIVLTVSFVLYRSNRFRKRANRQISETLEELKTTQDQLVAQEKMAVLGQLVSGIAHEINTPLGAIQGLIQPVNDHFAFVISQLNHGLKGVPEDLHSLLLVLMKHYGSEKSNFNTQAKRVARKALNESLSEFGIQASKPTIEYLLDIGVVELNASWKKTLKLPNHEAVLKLIHSVVMHERGTQQMETIVNKIASMVSALQTYSQPERAEDIKEAIDLRENIDQVLVLLENEFKKGVQLIKSYPETLKPIQCNPEALSQVWTNLLINAIQALEGKGTVEVEIEETAEQITVSIKDDGCGIKEEDKDKIFEAFYATKKRGYGTGLGLNIVRKIVMNHRGKIKLKVETGKTIFKTTFSKTL
ncbi:MAG: ATP-binding protein [Bacteroidota bacterium]